MRLTVSAATETGAVSEVHGRNLNKRVIGEKMGLFFPFSVKAFPHYLPPLPNAVRAQLESCPSPGAGPASCSLHTAWVTNISTLRGQWAQVPVFLSHSLPLTHTLLRGHTYFSTSDHAYIQLDSHTHSSACREIHTHSHAHTTT